MASAGFDGKVVLWDMADRANPRRLGEPLVGPSRDGLSFAFAPDGQTLATADEDGTVVLWDLADLARPRRLGEPLTGHPLGMSDVVFAPDGQIMASVGDATTDLTTLLLWDLGDLLQTRDTVLARACARAERGFNREEWDRYVPSLDYQESCPT
jgi:WD40 repeat protein